MMDVRGELSAFGLMRCALRHSLWAAACALLCLPMGCDGNETPDAGVSMSDASDVQDASSTNDSGVVPEDSGASNDAGMPSDSGVSMDAGPDGGGAGTRCVDLRADAIANTSPAASGVDHALQTNGFVSALSAPFPTNAWWQNLVLGSRSQTVNVLPYLVQTKDDRLSVGVPRLTRASTFMFSSHVEDVTLGAAEALASRAVSAFDALSVTMNWTGASAGSMRAPLVRGMPYATMFYEGLTPQVATVHALLSVNDAALSEGAEVSGTRFTLQFNSGQTWILYTSSSVTFRRVGNALVATAPMTGHVRIAYPSDAMYVDELDAHADAVPVGGEVSLQSCGELGVMEFRFSRSGSGDLLMMAMPHHRRILESATVVADPVYETIRGNLSGVIGNTWRMEEPMTSIGFAAPRSIPTTRVEAIRAALVADQGLMPRATDTYFGAKQVAAMGRLALIADELGETTIASDIRGRLATALAPWIAGAMERLRYDRRWGGLVAAGAEADPGASFGQGYYNDHHFHYGYMIYAAAALARGDASWLATHRDAVDVLVRDIANPSSTDSYFTPFRNMDWFVGHSWAAGLFEFGDSRNQESTSEAVNAWYAVALWGEVTARASLRDLGRLMTATEIRSAQLYWQIQADNEVYAGTDFANNRVVGVLWSTKVDYATFFGGNVEFIHGIQMLPYTPMTEALLAPAWIEVEYPVVSTALTRASPALGDGWRGFIYMAHAVIDSATAWDEVNTLSGFDDGNSLTNTLYWVATRP